MASLRLQIQTEALLLSPLRYLYKRNALNIFANRAMTPITPIVSACGDMSEKILYIVLTKTHVPSKNIQYPLNKAALALVTITLFKT